MICVRLQFGNISQKQMVSLVIGRNDMEIEYGFLKLTNTSAEVTLNVPVGHTTPSYESECFSLPVILLLVHLNIPTER